MKANKLFMLNIRRTNTSGGFSLVELMVAMAIGLVLMLALSYIYVNSSQTARTVDTASRMQEGARFVFEQMAHDIRMTGSTGCSSATMVNVVASDGTDDKWYYRLFSEPLFGWDGAAKFASANDGTDSLAVLFADPDAANQVTSYASPKFTLGSAKPELGQVLVVSDCTNVALFRNSTKENNAAYHGQDKYNCTENLGSPAAATCDTVNAGGGTAYSYAANAWVRPLIAEVFYVATNATSNEPTLYRKKLADDGATLATEEVLEGVEDMQITYGMDTTGTPDGQIDAYYSWDKIPTDAGLGATAADRYKRILAVRINLLMVSKIGEAQTYGKQKIYFNGADVEKNDRKLRRAFVTTIAIKNRL